MRVTTGETFIDVSTVGDNDIVMAIDKHGEIRQLREVEAFVGVAFQWEQILTTVACADISYRRFDTRQAAMEVAITDRQNKVFAFTNYDQVKKWIGEQK